MKQKLGFASYLAQCIDRGGNSVMDADTLLKRVYEVLVPVLAKAFQPTKQGLLSGSLPAVVSQGWALLCQRLSQGNGFKNIYYWEAWDRFLGGDNNKDCCILAEFKCQIIKALQETEVMTPGSRGVSTLYRVLDQSKELQSMDYILRMMAEVKGKNGYASSPAPLAPTLNFFIDCLLNRLIRGDDHEVFHLFDKSCELTALSKILAPMTSVEREDVLIVSGPDGLKGQHTRFEKSSDLPLSFILDPTKAYKICLLESELPPAGREGAICLNIPADSLIDMKSCSFPTKPPFILSATGSFELPDDLFFRDGQIVVLGIPVENVIPPSGYKLVSAIDSATFQSYYQNRRARPEGEKIEARAYVFSEKINLTGLDIDLFTGKSGRYLLKNADTKYPLSTRWYDELIFACYWGRIPVSKLREFHSPYAMDLREYPLEMLPLPLQLPAPQKPQPNREERLSYQRTYREDDSMLEWLKKGYHLINQQGWQILWRQGVRDFSAFVFDRTHSSFPRLIEDLDLREMHPEIMQTLPATSDTRLPLGLEPYYCKSLTREYKAKAKAHKKLAILTLGLSLLFFYIRHCLRRRLVRRLPEAAQAEVSRILAPFKKRPITRAASDYLNYQFGQLQEVQLLRRTQRNLLFGSLPERDSARYFDSMRYLPLFQTRRALTSFVKKAYRGPKVEREGYERYIKENLESMTPWLDDVVTEQDLDAKNELMSPLFCALMLQAMGHKKLRKEFSSKLLRSENRYFLGLLLALFQPIAERIKKENSSLFFKRSRDRFQFKTKFSVLVGYQKRPDNTQLKDYYASGHRVLSNIFRILCKIDKINKKDPYQENRWSFLTDLSPQLIVKEPKWCRSRS